MLAFVEIAVNVNLTAFINKQVSLKTDKIFNFNDKKKIIIANIVDKKERSFVAKKKS
jgi:hypothetical protein